VQPNEIEDEALQERAGPTPLDPAQVHVLRIRIALLAAAAVLAVFAFDLGPLRETPLPRLAAPGLALLLALAFVILYPPRRYRSWGYDEGADEIEIGRGRWFQVRTIVPFGRVQHIDVAQGPIQRPFGLATLILHTAGTHGASVPLPGLRHDDAEAMRDRIRAKIKQDLV
jgi:membrane protein YdbS with pleckstrin-like domain